VTGHPPVTRCHPAPVVFGFHEVSALRHTLHAQAALCGMPEPARESFVLAANEIATNAVVHGGGQGQLRLWCDQTHLHCQISDHGPGLSASAITTHLPPHSAPSGRGLWIAARLCHLTIHDNIPGPGTVVELSVVLDRPSRDPDRPSRNPDRRRPGPAGAPATLPTGQALFCRGCQPRTPANPSTAACDRS
jgi:anti-sigma regulatory factor (Ser/Thr protein kinase)